MKLVKIFNSHQSRNYLFLYEFNYHYKYVFKVIIIDIFLKYLSS